VFKYNKKSRAKAQEFKRGGAGKRKKEPQRKKSTSATPGVLLQ
jgi:hypothetical protein